MSGELISVGAFVILVNMLINTKSVLIVLVIIHIIMERSLRLVNMACVLTIVVGMLRIRWTHNLGDHAHH